MSRKRLHLSMPVVLLAMAAMAVCVRLGFWQLERAEVKARWHSELAERQGQGEKTPADLLALDDPGNYPVRLRGQPDNTRVVLLDNRIHERQAGYHVLTPVLSDNGVWVLLNRGWIGRGTDRAVLPPIPALPADVDVTGRSYVYSDRTFTLAEDDLSAPQWPLRVQKVDTKALGEAMGIALAPFEVRAEPDTPLESDAEFPRLWSDPVMGPERHRAYAVQWFAMAAAVLLLSLFAAWRVPRRPNDELDA